MQFEVFTVPAGGGEAMGELNRFLASRRVIGVEKHLVTTGGSGPVWVFCVEYLTGLEPTGKGGGSTAARIDYREVLPPEDFAVFAKLREVREVRKALAEKDGVPPYSIFTNEQLATMVRERITTVEGLRKIEPRESRRLVEQQRQELPRGEPQQEQAEEQEQQPRLPPGPSTPPASAPLRPEAVPASAPSRSKGSGQTAERPPAAGSTGWISGANVPGGPPFRLRSNERQTAPRPGNRQALGTR